jgi:hypothetical protein
MLLRNVAWISQAITCYVSPDRSFVPVSVLINMTLRQAGEHSFAASMRRYCQRCSCHPMMEAIWFLQEPHDVTTQTTAFFRRVKVPEINLNIQTYVAVPLKWDYANNMLSVIVCLALSMTLECISWHLSPFISTAYFANTCSHPVSACVSAFRC